MCGIAGIIGKRSDEQLDHMLKVQHYRGPDDTGRFIDGHYAALGHNRLAIIDLSEQSNQPFLDNSRRYTIVFNGEIYNYLELREELKSFYNFKTQSDTEVLLAAYIHYGSACLSLLNGMFSFAIWDKEEKKLFAARDRFGVKPFHYSINSEAFIFASEIKALHAGGVLKSPRPKAWANYFVHGSYGMPSETFWENIHQLSGGYYLELENGNLKIEKWYDFEKAVANIVELDYETAKANYLDLLHDSIKLRFRADVPIGINVSGGLDSSILLGLVNDYFDGAGDVNAFTFYSDDLRYDEIEKVAAMTQSKDVNLRKVLISPAEIPDLAAFISEIQDEPFGGIPTLAYAKIFEVASKNGIKVLLDGQGMDEQWAGYDYYASKTDLLIQGVTSSPYRTNILSEQFRSLADVQTYPKPFDNKLQNTQYRDLFFTKIPRVLRFCDRISMAYSTELREPFLDYRLVEFAFAQSEDRKIKDGMGKWMLRDIGLVYTDDAVAKTEKRPLQTPQREWLGLELKEYVEMCISKIKKSDYKDWFDHEQLTLEYQRYLDGDNQSGFHIWQWVNFAILL